jgi:hypothetical protein
MQQIQIDTMKNLTAAPCGKCGSMMRLVGSEPHPVRADTDLLTFSCTQCEAIEVMPVALAGPASS